MTLDDMAREAGALLARHNLTICTAESCTGGLIASSITDVPGSSEYFLGGVVTYSNLAKHQLLAVPDSTLRRFGAVSAPVAYEMARRARRLFGADIAVSATGIAGPGGGTPTKPVGLVYVGLATPRVTVVHRALLPHDRRGNKLATAILALESVLREAGTLGGAA